jgi:hypothetical protein
MRIIAKILQSVLVNHFYKLNAGFFAFLFFGLFGVVRGGQLIEFHLGLIQAILSGPLFLAMIICIWGLYTAKCINYITKRMMEPGLSFLACLNRLPRKQVWYWMCLLHFEIYLPVIAYVFIILIVAMREQQYQQAFIIMICNAIFFIVAVSRYFKTLEQHSNDSLLLKIHVPDFSFRKPVFLYSLIYIWRERKLLFMLTKTFTLVYLYGFIQFYEPYRYDIRPMLLSLLLVLSSHLTLIYEMRNFENDYLLFCRNLPISIFKRFFQQLLLFLVLLTPELLFVWKGYPLHFNLIDFSQILLMILAIPAFMNAILYTSSMSLEDYMKLVFAFVAALFFLILYDLGILVFVFVLVLALVFFYFHFFEFEKANTVKEH